MRCLKDPYNWNLGLLDDNDDALEVNRTYHKGVRQLGLCLFPFSFSPSPFPSPTRPHPLTLSALNDVGFLLKIFFGVFVLYLDPVSLHRKN